MSAVNDNSLLISIPEVKLRTLAGKECRHVTYVPPPQRGMPDMHVVKEILHYSDGTSEPNVLTVKDYKRPFWITKKGCQNHEDKKEWEHLDRLNQYTSTEHAMPDYITRLLGTSSAKGNLRKANTSQYVYGSDINSTALIKQTYITKYTNHKTKYSVSVMDTETDVVHGTGDILMATFSFKTVCFTACLKSFMANVPDPQAAVSAAMKKYLGDIVEKRGIKDELVLVDNPGQLIIEVFKAAHKHKPDFLAFWNISFDIGVILKMCEKYKVNPEDIFSDPSLPAEYRYFKWKEGPDQKVTASGKVTPIKNHARWHTVFAPASFYCIDGMCAYKHVRLAEPELPSYSLDNILKATINRGKLKFTEADEYSGLRWHIFMQTNYPVEYLIYNRFDCISVEMLDETTNDLSVSLPLYSGCSDFQYFNSQPRRIVDDLHNYVISKYKRVIGSTGRKNDELAEENELTYDLRDWIVALPAHLITDDGVCIIEEDPELKTRIYLDVADLDVSAAYPRSQCVMNISKETTRKEIIEIKGIDEVTARMQGINISGGSTNAMEYCQTMFGMPTLGEMLDHFNELEV